MSTPRRPLLGLLVAQFLGAFNDNAFKLIATLLGIRAATAAIAPGSAEYEFAAQTQTTLAFVALTLPLAVFSLPAGVLADRVSKRSLIVAMKALEVVLMAAATVALLIAPGAHWTVIAILVLMGLQSALFSPGKYGILPELIPHEKLSAANGLLELWSFVGIVLGTVAGGLLLSLGDRWGGTWVAVAGLAVLAVVGFVASLWVPRVPPAAAAAAPRSAFETLRGAQRVMWRDRPLRLAVIGLAFFWGAASLLGQDMLVYGKSVLGLDDETAALPLGLFAVGVACGSLLAGRLSAGKVEVGLIPLGSLGIAAVTLAVGAFVPAFFWTATAMALMGVASGFMLVPLNALLQWRSPASRRGAVIALANVVSFAAILGGSLGAQAMAQAGLDSRGILLGGGALAVLGTLWALWLLPDAFLRLVVFLLTHTLYRLDVVGREHVPERGAALLAPNHVSLMDGLFLMASVDRPVRFLVDSAYYEHWLLRPFMRALGFIPVQAGSGAGSVHRSLTAAGDALGRGDLVGIFPEGEISRTGAMLPFRRGITRIAEGRDAPIVPVHLDRVWGSVFSFSGGRFVLKWPKRAPYPVTLTFGAPLPATTPLHALRTAVQDLGAQAWAARRESSRTLALSFAGRTRRWPFMPLLLGRRRRKVGRGRALLEAMALARALRAEWSATERVALLFPPSSASVIAALAVAMAGRTAVWLDPHADAATQDAQLAAAGAGALLVSEAWLTARKQAAPAGVASVTIEAARARITGGARLAARFGAMFAFGRLALRLCGARKRPGPQDAAAVVFAGTAPVALSWGALGSQIAGLGQVLPIGVGDRIATTCGLHTALGQVVLWLAAARALELVQQDSDDAPSLARAVTRYAADVLVTEPGRLRALVDGCRPGQLGSLQVVLSLGVGHDPAVLDAFEARFGVRPLAGLARADLGPIVTVSAPGFRAAGFRQAGSRRDYVGHPLPGVGVKIVDPGSGAEVAPDTEGAIALRGGHAEGDWQVTDLRGRVDGDGFLALGEG